MPLSEHEQRVLEEIERRLHEEDPRFARQVARRPRLSDAGRLKLAIALFIAGLLVLIAFFMTRALLLGVAAFGAMVTGIVLAAGAVGGMDGLRRDRGRRLSRALSEWEIRTKRRYRRR